MTEELGLPPLDHNQPPSDVFIRAADLIETTNRWLKERSVIADAEMAGAAQRLMGQLRAAREDLNKAKKAERKPHDDAVAAINARYLDPSELVDLALSKMEPLTRAWLQAETLRLERVSAEKRRIAAEAIQVAQQATDAAHKVGASVEAHLAADRAIKTAETLADEAAALLTRARLRDDQMTRAMSLHRTWRARVIDEAKALDTYAGHPEVKAAALASITRVASREAKAAKDPAKAPPGVEFFVTETAV